jgi:hypothetical protein
MDRRIRVHPVPLERVKLVAVALLAMLALSCAIETNGAMATELSAPGAASWSSSRYDLVVRGEDGLIYHKYWDNGSGPENGWSTWGSLGAPSVGAASSPTVTTPGSNILQVFVRGGDNRIWNDNWNNGQGSAPGGWSGWKAIPNTDNATWAPAATDGADTQPDVFYTGTDNAIYYTRYDSQLGWISPVSLGGVVQGSPAASTTAGGRMQLAVRGGAPENRIYNKWADSPSAWTAWGQIPNAFTSMSPTASTGDDGQLQTFFRGASSASMYHEYWNPSSGWVGPGAIPGVSLVSSPAAARLHLYYRDSFGNVIGTHYDPTLGWISPSSKGQPSSDELLFREQNSTAVFWMNEGQRYWITSPEVAAAAGLDLTSVIVLPDGSLASIPRATDITMSTVAEGWPEPDPTTAEASGSWKHVSDDTLEGFSQDNRAKISGTIKWYRGKSLKAYLRRGNFAAGSFVSAYGSVPCIWARVDWSYPSGSVSFPPLGGSISGVSVVGNRYVSCRKEGWSAPDAIPLYGLGYAKAFLHSETIEVCTSNSKAEGPKNCAWLQETWGN